MKTSEFNFDLPEHLIAQFPPEKRGQSRLMTLDRVTGKRRHSTVAKLPEILCGDKFLSPSGEKPLLVFNDTKVRKARLIGIAQDTGAEAEFLLLEEIMKGERVAGSGSGRSTIPTPRSLLWKVMAKRVKRKKPGSIYLFTGSNGVEAARAAVAGFDGGYLLLEFDRHIDDEWLFKYGHMPLPPYIKRKDVKTDEERYQTVYANITGSAAAPTAGLHFTKEILDTISANGMETAFITLHVGLGTFLPVRTQAIEDHQMHNENFFITEETAKKIMQAKNNGRKIVAVGTTSLRALESAACEEGIKTGQLSTSIFIYPGYRFKLVDALFTNFHTPFSTLLMLVSAFAGKELILESYAEAVKEGYRFFSYGDAMLIY